MAYSKRIETLCSLLGKAKTFADVGCDHGFCSEYMLKNEPGRSVHAVAFACGFNDSNYFSYKYKKQYGVSPKKVKKLKKL